MFSKKKKKLYKIRFLKVYGIYEVIISGKDAEHALKKFKKQEYYTSIYSIEEYKVWDNMLSNLVIMIDVWIFL